MGKASFAICCVSLVIALALASRSACAGACDDWPTRPGCTTDDGLPLPPLIYPEQSVESTWYTRFDYFAWNEQSDGQRIADESGALYTLGYQRRMGSKRLRLELFDSVVHFNGVDSGGETVLSTTGYMGACGEGEWVYDFDVRPANTMSFVAGLGSRIWLRDLRDGFVPSTNGISPGRQETWWTIYPYLGLEKKWLLENGEEIFVSGRLGCTAVTYQMSSYVRVFKDSDGTEIGHIDPAPLFPRPNLTSQIECGLRYAQFSASACFESMAWQESGEARGVSQPDSRMITIGLKLGLSF